MTSRLLLTDYVGVDRQTGMTITGVAHLASCVRDVLGTFKRSCVMARDYGTEGMRHLGAPINSSTIADIVADTAQALHAWEPRIKLKRVLATAAGPEGRLTVDLIVQVQGREIRLERVI